MRRFFAPPDRFDGTQIALAPDETRHLRKVLRLGVGDEANVFDGEGQEFYCSIREISKGGATLSVIEQVPPVCPESPLDLTLAPTVLNGDKYDLIVQKAVELGVKHFVPLITLRCEVKPKDAMRRVERWRRIVLEATKQCGRATLMNVAEPVEFEKLVSDPSVDNAVMFSERDGAEFKNLKIGKKITALIGPKGGWDDSELTMARSSALRIVTLGGRILRSETAAMAITSILQHRFGDLQ